MPSAGTPRPNTETPPPCPNGHPLDRRFSEKDETAFTPEWETKAAISAILDITLKPLSFRQQLRAILDILVSISWLRAAHKGAIFIANEHHELVMVAQHKLSEPLLEKCARIPFGRCLCGKAAENRQMIFKTCVDSEHEIDFPGMEPHGHYNVPLLDDQGEVVGVLVLYLAHGHRPHPEESGFMKMLGNTLSHIIVTRNLKLRAEIGRLRLHKAQTEMLQKLVAASEFRDNDTGNHIKRMSQYAVAIAEAIGVDEQGCKLLELAAPMHDIGKVGIPDNILQKPGNLTAEEFATMQQHPLIGARILTGDHPLIEASRDISLTHHEKWDGSGYPQGLAGEDIPLFGRICALADVFDALTSSRPYKKAWPLDEALDFIRKNAGSHFDPHLVDAFFDCLPKILSIKSIYDERNVDLPSDPGCLQEKDTHEGIVSWTPSLSIDIGIIDKQHQYFVNLINRIHLAVEESHAAEVVDGLLDMQEYGRVHFDEEEALMRHYGYPNEREHALMHRGFMEKTRRFIDELETTPLAVGTEMCQYLLQWLLGHIKTADMAFGRYIDDRSSNSPLGCPSIILDTHLVVE